MGFLTAPKIGGWAEARVEGTGTVDTGEGISLPSSKEITLGGQATDSTANPRQKINRSVLEAEMHLPICWRVL